MNRRKNLFDRDKAKRWRPWQFSLSNILLLMVIVGLSVSWRLDRTRLLKKDRWMQSQAVYSLMNRVSAERETNVQLKAKLKRYEDSLAIRPQDAHPGYRPAERSRAVLIWRGAKIDVWDDVSAKVPD